MKTVTLLFLVRGNEILLAMKKRGFGADKWNGVGGKAEHDETILQAVIRECQEEINVTPVNPQHIGTVRFFDETDPDFHHNCHIFRAEKWQGTPTETEEMRPHWFNQDAMPYDEMWPADRIWLPYLLESQHFTGHVTAGANGIVKDHDIALVDPITLKTAS